MEEALWLEAQGVDAIIPQGLEAGRHRGIFLHEELSTQVGTFAPLPQIVQVTTANLTAPLRESASRRLSRPVG